jgi:very-short-patch-repair endonuclease
MGKLLRPQTFRARALRRSATVAERVLWTLLRNRGLEGAKFRRQVPLGPFIVDFYCEAAKLVIEADGAAHFPPPPRDLARDHFLRAVGICVLRFENSQILDNADHVIEVVRRVLRRASRVL